MQSIARSKSIFASVCNEEAAEKGERRREPRRCQATAEQSWVSNLLFIYLFVTCGILIICLTRSYPIAFCILVRRVM